MGALRRRISLSVCSMFGMSLAFGVCSTLWIGPRSTVPSALASRGRVDLVARLEQQATQKSGSFDANGSAIALMAGALCAGLALRSSKPGRRTCLAAARLHGHPQTRSPLVNWYCYEAGIPIEMRDPRPSPHPFEQVPHLSDDGGVEVFESGAILLYLADKYGGCDTPEKRAKYTKWVMWANATLDGLCFGQGMSGTRIASPGKAMDILEDMLGKSEWLVENEFSVADVAVASYLNYVPIFFGQVDLRQRPNIAAYMKRCADRPAFTEAFGAQHAAAVKAQVLG